MPPLLLALMGPTASGKSDVAERLADRIGALLLNGDAFQVYRHMDVGTAKPHRRDIYRLLDLKNPDEEFGVGEYVLLAADVLRDAFAAGTSCIVVGGSGLYIRALFEGYGSMRGKPDPRLRQALDSELDQQGLAHLVERLRVADPSRAAAIDLRNPVRVRRALEIALSPEPPLAFELPPFRKRKLAIAVDTEDLSARIRARVERMVQNGWAQEVVNLCRMGYGPADPGFRALGYRAMWRHVQGEIMLEDAAASAVRDTVGYAKRQRTWLRSEPNVSLIPGSDPEEMFEHALLAARLDSE